MFGDEAMYIEYQGEYYVLNLTDQCPAPGINVGVARSSVHKSATEESYKSMPTGPDAMPKES